MPGLGYLEKTIMQKNYQNAPEHKRRRKKTCVLCGTEFVSSAPNQRYCSLACREANKKRKRQEWLENHPGFMAEYMREYRKRLKEDSIATEQKK